MTSHVWRLYSFLEFLKCRERGLKQVQAQLFNCNVAILEAGVLLKMGSVSVRGECWDSVAHFGDKLSGHSNVQWMHTIFVQYYFSYCTNHDMLLVICEYSFYLVTLLKVIILKMLVVILSKL